MDRGTKFTRIISGHPSSPHTIAMGGACVLNVCPSRNIQFFYIRILLIILRIITKAWRELVNSVYSKKRGKKKKVTFFFGKIITTELS